MEYDFQGNRKKKGGYYKTVSNRLTPIPTLSSTRQQIMDYMEVCTNLPRADLEETWNDKMKVNELIVDYLEILKFKYDEEKDRFRSRAYFRAAKAIKNSPTPILSGKQAQSLEGIGLGIAKKIDEIAITGSLQFIDKEGKQAVEKRRHKRDVVNKFMGIWGVGRVQAETWYRQQYKSFADLEKHTTLAKNQKLSIRYHKDLTTPIPRDVIDEYRKTVESLLHELDPKVRLEVGGSYRRGASFSGDIDFIISSSDKGIIENIAEKLKGVHILQKGKSKISVILRLPNGQMAQVDFFYVAPKHWGAGLVGWTGSGEFNRMLRATATRRGYKLSEKTLSVRETGKVVDTPTEKSVFKALGMKYVPPDRRY